MEKELKKILQKAKYQVDPDLPINIWNNILKREKRINKIKLWAFSISGLASLAGMVPMYKILASDIVRSGVYEYLSLLFSGNSAILSYSKELFFSIAETLPTTSIIFSLSLVFVLFLSLKYVTREIIKDQLLLSY